MAVAAESIDSAFERELNELRLQQRMTQHPFIKKLLEGKVTRDQLKVHAVQQYIHTIVFPNALANLVARCRIPQMQAGLAEGLYEEFTGQITKTKSHLDLFFDYAHTLGLSREFLENHSYVTPGMGAVVHWYLYSTSQLDPLVGIASLAIAAEGQNANLKGDPGASGLMIKALTEHYGFTKDQLEFWHVHNYADQEHSTEGVKLVCKYAQTDRQKEVVRSAVRHTQNCMFAAYQDVLTYSFEDVTSNNCAMFY